MAKPISNALKVIIVPAQELGPNPQNPYDRLTEGERRARFIAILAGLYRDWKSRNSEEAPTERAA